MSGVRWSVAGGRTPTGWGLSAQLQRPMIRKLCLGYAKCRRLPSFSRAPICGTAKRDEHQANGTESGTVLKDEICLLSFG